MEEKGTGLTLAELGHLLREERIRHGLSVEAIADQLKITSRVVRAIEDGDVESMPHAVYARGFIRSYAQLLGIGEELVQGGCVELRESEEFPPAPAPLDIATSKGRGFRIPWLTVFLCVVFVLGGIWYSRDKLPLGPLSSIGKVTEQVASPVTSLSPDEPVSGVQPAQADEGSVSAEEPAAQQGETSSGNGTAATEVSADSSSPTSSVQTQETQPAVTQHQIVISAIAPCWIHTTADSENAMQRTLKKGDSVTLTFSDHLVLKLGNAGGVQIVYDGREMTDIGKTGQVRTISFPEDVQN